MARVLYCAFDRVPAPKGASRHIRAFVRGLVAAGHQVEVCLLTAPDLREIDGARCLPPPPPTDSLLARALAFGNRALRYAQAGRYDLIHFRSPWEGLPLVQWPDHPPLLFEVNGLPSVEWPIAYPALTEQPDLVAKLWRREQAVLAGVDAVITPSQVTAKWLQELGLRRIEVIANGVDPGEWRGEPTPWAERRPEIFYMGTFSPWQGIETAVRALSYLPPPLRLRLVGPRERMGGGRWLRLAGQLGVAQRLLIHPAVAPATLLPWLRQALVAIAPLAADRRNGLQGACPLKILEYLAAGTPVVASRLPLVENLVQHGESAWLCQADDPQALAQAILTVTTQPTLGERLTAGGLALAHGYRWQASIDRLLTLYRALLR